MRSLLLCITLALTSCVDFPKSTQPSDVESACNTFLAVFDGARKSGLSCEEGRLKAQTAAPMCTITVVCRTLPVEVDSGLSQ